MWHHCKFGDVISIKKGKAITRKDATVGPYPVILGGKAPAYYINQYNRDGKTIVISRSGASAGYVSFWKEPIFVTDGFIIDPTKNIDHDFLYYLLKSKQSELSHSQRGSAIPHVTPSLIRNIAIEIPSLVSQQKIVSILTNYDDSIELNNKRIAILEEMAMRTYREWFVFFRFPGHETTEFVDGLPKGWEYKQLEEFIKFDRGCSYTSEEIDVTEGVKLINLKNIKSYGGYNYDGLKLFAGNYKPQHIVKKGDLVMGVTDMTQDRRTVGAVTLIPEYSETAIISTDLARVKSKLPNIFLYTMFRFGGYSKFISEFANGSNVLHLKPSAIRKQLLLIPSLKIIQQFDDILSPIVDEMEILTSKNSQLQQMRDRLLPQLMSGQLEVTP